MFEGDTTDHRAGIALEPLIAEIQTNNTSYLIGKNPMGISVGYGPNNAAWRICGGVRRSVGPTDAGPVHTSVPNAVKNSHIGLGNVSRGCDRGRYDYLKEITSCKLGR